MMLLFLSNSSPFQLIKKVKDEEANEFNHSLYDLNMKVLRPYAAAQTCHFPTSKAKTFSNWANPAAVKETPKYKERLDTFLLLFSSILIFQLYLSSSFLKTW